MNQNTQHTPGPWNITDTQSPSRGRRLVISQEGTGNYVGQVSINPDESRAEIETAKANAALIASAPDLLAERDRLKVEFVGEKAKALGLAHALESVKAANVEAEAALGENLHWLADQFDLKIRQKDQEVLRRLAQLNSAWVALVKAGAK